MRINRVNYSEWASLVNSQWALTCSSQPSGDWWLIQLCSLQFDISRWYLLRTDLVAFSWVAFLPNHPLDWGFRSLPYLGVQQSTFVLCNPSPTPTGHYLRPCCSSWANPAETTDCHLVTSPSFVSTEALLFQLPRPGECVREHKARESRELTIPGDLIHTGLGTSYSLILFPN